MHLTSKIAALDLGGTNLRGACIEGAQPHRIASIKVAAEGTVEDVMKEIFDFTDALIDNSVEGIGIGVPGMVDASTGVVYDVQHIPAWKEVNLKALMERRYKLPVKLNNDANCFALGELHFGSGKGESSLIGLTIGTGLGAGIIINNTLYEGTTGGAGEFGMAAYLDKNYEYYASGRFFQHEYKADGPTVFEAARKADTDALNMYAQFGRHLGNAIKMIMYCYDPALIILGGSVRHAWPFFSASMWQEVNQFAYARAVRQIRILPSCLQNSGLLGAAALHY
jgi:glucokinase